MPVAEPIERPPSPEPHLPTTPHHLEAEWTPDLFARQYDIINDRHRICLVSGPMKTGKSIGICHKIARHLWEVNGAYVGIFVTSYKVATDGGSWTDLINVMRQWIDSGMLSVDNQPIEFTSFIRGDDEGGPKLDAKSRTPFFKIRNMHGGESECRLFSIDNENELEAKVKGLRLSAVWCVELSTFKSKKVMTLTISRLRALGVSYEDHFWIADTNPAEEGKAHWAYKVFYTDRTDPDYPDKDFQANLGLLEIFLQDNTKLDPRERQELENLYRDTPDEYDRFVLGLWPEGAAIRREVFADILTTFHLLDKPIDIDRHTETLITGWDMGAVNHAFLILERRIINDLTFWMALAEVVIIKKETSIADFTIQCLDQMIAINEFYKKQWPGFPGFTWVHWSDNSATAYHRPQVGDVDAMIVKEASQNQIELQGVDKPQGSVAEDIRMVRTLLRERRLFIGSNCPNLRQTMERIKRGNRHDIDPGDPLKHIFDALRYPIRAETLEDLNSRPNQAGQRVIHLPIR